MIDYKIENGHAEILKWYRNRKGERKTRIIKDFEPYFLVKDDEFVPNDARIVRVDPTDIKSLSGERLKRIVTRLPMDVRELREKFSRTWEADVPFADRYRIDVGEKPIENPVILFFDIETQNDLDINSDKEMISLACYDNVSKEFTQFLWKDDQTKVIKQHKGNRNLVFARTEKEMLKIFVEYFRKVDPDIITGWNSNPFDLPFLHNRLEKTKIGGALLSPTGRTRIRNDELQIQGRYCFDLLPAYKKVHENEMDSFRLDDVANIELGTGKEGSSENIMEMWDHDIKSLIKYNIRDVEILVELEKKLELFKFYFEYAAKTNGSLENVYHNSKMVDSYLLTYAQNKRLALPTKQSSTGKNEKIKGATVFQPSKGLKRDIAIMDYKSLYPSIIISFNMSPETCNGFMDFDQDKKGILPSALEDLFEERARLKKAGKNNEQRVVKELMNSFYGVMLFSSFRLNNRDVGMSITNTGRNLLQWAKDHAEAINDKYKVVYGDTDSIFVEGVETREEAELIEKTINDSLDEFAEQNKLKRHIFQIEFENFIELGLFTGKKKRYALKTDEGYKIRGFETRRSSTPRMGRELQENILKEILEEKEKYEIFKELNETEKQIKENPDLEIIGVPATLTKNPEEYETNSQHLRASRYSNKYLEKTFKAHDKMLLVFVQSVPLNYPKTDVIALERGDELPEGFKLDYNKHIDKCVTSLTNPILEVLNWNRSVGKSVFSF